MHINYKKNRLLTNIFLVFIMVLTLGNSSLIQAASTSSFTVSPAAGTTITSNMQVSINSSLTIDENDSTNYGDFVFEIDKISVGKTTLEQFKTNISAASSIPAPFKLGEVIDLGDKYKVTVSFDYGTLNNEPYNGNFSIKYDTKYTYGTTYKGEATFKKTFNGQSNTELRDVNIVAPGGSYAMFDKWPSPVEDTSDNHFVLLPESNKNSFYLPINYTEKSIDNLKIKDTKPVKTEYTDALLYTADPNKDAYNYRGFRIYKIMEWGTSTHSPAVAKNATKDYEKYISFDSDGNFHFDLPDGLKDTESLVIQYALAVTSDPEDKWKDANKATMDYRLTGDTVDKNITKSIPLKPKFDNNDSFSFYKKADKDTIFVNKNEQFIDGQEIEYTLRVRTYAGGLITADNKFTDILDSNLEFVSTTIDTSKWKYNVSGNTFSFSNISEIGENTSYEFKIKAKVLKATENYVVKNVFTSPSLTVSSNTTTTILLKGSSVRVEYVDLDGNTIAPNSVIAGFVGDEYTTTSKTLDTWHLVRTEGSVSGVLTEDEQTVKYIYDRDNGAPVTVNYKDTDGNTLAKSEVLNGKIDASYQTIAKKIDECSLTTTPKNAQGKFTTEAQSVDYIYTKIYTLSFNLNKAKGTTPVSQELKENQLGVKPANPTRSGYTFKGWNTKQDGSGKMWDFSSSKMPASDVELFATWLKDGDPILPITGNNILSILFLSLTISSSLGFIYIKRHRFNN